jgi:hypothetical protein
MFAGDKGDGTQKAKDICKTCPHTVKCLQFAVDHQMDFGVWGGVGPRTRRRMRRGTNVPRRPVSICGTTGGYTAHTRRGEPRCRACQDAWNAYQRMQRAERRNARMGAA